MARDLRLAALVLAAGSGTRFSAEPGAKLLDPIDGRPMLEHVLRAVRAFEPEATIVVLGHGAPRIERAIGWSGEMRVVNPAPHRGLASSLRVGIDALRGLPLDLDGTFIVLGDQPRLRTSVMNELAEAAARARPADRPAVVPRYTTSGPRNPALLLRPAWVWVDELEGDRGLAALIDSRPDMVLEVPVDGVMPDVDTVADLERLRRAGP